MGERPVRAKGLLVRGLRSACETSNAGQRRTGSRRLVDTARVGAWSPCTTLRNEGLRSHALTRLRIYPRTNTIDGMRRLALELWRCSDARIPPRCYRPWRLSPLCRRDGAQSPSYAHGRIASVCRVLPLFVSELLVPLRSVSSAFAFRRSASICIESVVVSIACPSSVTCCVDAWTCGDRFRSVRPESVVDRSAPLSHTLGV